MHAKVNFFEVTHVEKKNIDVLIAYFGDGIASAVRRTNALVEMRVIALFIGDDSLSNFEPVFKVVA